MVKDDHGSRKIPVKKYIGRSITCFNTGLLRLYTHHIQANPFRMGIKSGPFQRIMLSRSRHMRFRLMRTVNFQWISQIGGYRVCRFACDGCLVQAKARNGCIFECSAPTISPVAFPPLCLPSTTYYHHAVLSEPMPRLCDWFILRFLCIWLAFHTAFAASDDVFVDDDGVDPVTGSSILYTPKGAWNTGQNCTICLAEPDSTLAFMHTWHDGTFTPGSPTLNATFQFSGNTSASQEA